MKTIRFQLLLLALFVMVGCQKDEMSTSMKKGSYSLVATIENNDSTSRTVVDENGGVEWVATDAIGVFGTQTKNAKFESTGSGANVTFVGELESSHEEPTLAYYPYDKNASLDGNALSFTLPSEYSYTGQSYAPMLGIKQANGDFVFKHLVGLLKVTVKNMPENAKRLFVVSEGTEEKAAPAITGDVLVNDVTVSNATLSITQNKGHEVSIDLKNTSAQETYTFFIPVPVGEYPKLSVKLEMNDGVIYMDKIVSNVSMTRALMLDMPVLDAEIEETGITAIVRGTVDIENPEKFKVFSLIDESKLTKDGFSVEVFSNNLPQLIYVIDENDNIIMMSHKPISDGKVQINEETTALALITMMPSFVYDIQDNYSKTIKIINENPRYADIVDEVKKLVLDKKDIFDSQNTFLLSLMRTLINDLYAQPQTRGEIEGINKAPLNVNAREHQFVDIRNTSLFPAYEYYVYNSKEKLIFNDAIFSASSIGLVDRLSGNYGYNHYGPLTEVPLGEIGYGEYIFKFDKTTSRAKYLFGLNLFFDGFNALFNSIPILDPSCYSKYGIEWLMTSKGFAYLMNAVPSAALEGEGIKVFFELLVQDLINNGIDVYCKELMNFYSDKNVAKQVVSQIAKTNAERLVFCATRIIALYEVWKATANIFARIKCNLDAPDTILFKLCNYPDNDEIKSCTETELYISGGNEQEGHPKQKLELPLKVFVKSNYDDGTATTLTDYQGIKFEVVSGGGYVEESFVSVDEKTGVASTYWTLGEAGEQKVRVVAYGSISKQELSEPVYFTASFVETPASVTTTEATNITQTTATLSGNIQGYEADDFQHRYGIIYSTDANPTASNGTIVYSNNIQEDGNYSVDVASLTENTTYYYRAFVKEDGEYVYGDVMSFSTLNPVEDNEGMTEREILIAFYKATDGDNWTNNKNWCSDKPLGEWYGVTTDDEGHVTKISLSGSIVTSTGESIKFGLKGSANLSNLSKLEDLYLSHNELTSLTVENCPNLYRLSCSYNALTEVNVDRAESLILNNNQLTSLDFSDSNKFAKLVSLDADSNQLSTIDVSGCLNMEYLYVFDNMLTSLDVSQNKKIRVLYCSLNQLSYLNIDGCNELENIYMNNNLLESINLNGKTKLKRLHAHRNKLKSIDFTGLSNLEAPFITDNELTELDITDLVKITSIDCSRNKITKLKMHDKITTLRCSNNSFVNLDLSDNTNLQIFESRDNNIKTLNLGGCSNLTSFTFNNNCTVEVLDLTKCTSIKNLNVYNTCFIDLYLPTSLAGYRGNFEIWGDWIESENRYQYPNFHWQ